MEQRRMIAMSVGGIVTLVVFAVMMVMLAYGDLFPGRDKLIVLSIALGPVAMISVMIGYAVWWMVLFLLTLFGANEAPRDSGPVRPSRK